MRIPKPIQTLVIGVICVALHFVRRASCTSKIFLSFCWTCFSIGCAQKIRKKLVQLRRQCPQCQCKSRATFTISTSSKSRPENSISNDSAAPVISLVGGRRYTSQTSLKFLNNQRWLSFCRASNSKGGLLKHVMSVLISFLFYVKKSRLAVFLDGTHIARSFVGRVSSVRGPRSDDAKSRRVGAANRCFGHMHTLKSEKLRRLVAHPFPFMGTRTEMATMLGAQKSMSVIARSHTSVCTHVWP